MKVQEFKKYEQAADYHWQQTYGALRRRSPRMHAYYDIPVDLLKRKLKTRKARGLDLGCGDGVLVYKLRGAFDHVDGLDGSPTAITLASRQLEGRKRTNGSLLCGSCYQVPLKSASYDFVTAVEVIEHLEGPSAFLAEVARLLKVGGLFVCTTPNRAPEQLPTQVRDPYHVKEYVAAELRAELAEHFGAVEVRSAFPKALEDLYLHGRGVAPKAFRAAIKCARFVGLNPYVLSRPQPCATDALLVAIGIKT